MRGRLLPSLAVGAALWVVGVSAVAAGLSALGWWSPWLGWAVAVVVAVGCWWCVRLLPPVRMPVAASVALVAVVVGFTVWAGATHSEQVLPRRDAASNLQAAVSLASTGSRVVSVPPATVGGSSVLEVEGVTLGSPAFFAVGSSSSPAVQPQFVVGPAVVYGFGWWAGGGLGTEGGGGASGGSDADASDRAGGAFADASAGAASRPAGSPGADGGAGGGAGVALLLPAVAMGLALLALGLLVARVVGPWAGVAAAALTGVLFPVVHTARATYPEPLAMLTLTAGLLAATLAVAAERSPARSLRDALGARFSAGGGAAPGAPSAPGPGEGSADVGSGVGAAPDAGAAATGAPSGEGTTSSHVPASGLGRDGADDGSVVGAASGEAAASGLGREGAEDGSVVGAASGEAAASGLGRCGADDGSGAPTASGFVGDASSQGAALSRAPLASLVRSDASARAGLLAGVLVGGTGLVRVDALREVVLLLPVLALGAAFGARWARPVLVGLGASLLVAAVAAVGLSWQYLASIAASLLPLLALGVLVGGGSWVALVLWRRGRRLPPVVLRRLPDAAAVAVVVVGLYLAARPLWQVARQDPNDPGSRYVAGMQAREGLAVDGGRTYAEQTVAWLSWYVGPVALVVALAVLAVLVRRAVLSAQSRVVDAWLPPLVVAAGSTLLTLVRPGITPDHPWADRRLLVALPFVVALVVTGLSWGVRRVVGRSTDSGAEAGQPWGSGRPWVRAAAAAGVGVGALSVVVPAVAATWPHRAGGVERGSLAAVRSVCQSLRPGDVVMAVDSRAANEWPQVMRGMCGVPALSTTAGLRKDDERLAAAVAAASAGVREQGGRLVLLAADSSATLDGLGVRPTAVTDVMVREDQHVLEQRPSRTDPLPVRVWLAPAP